MLMARWRGALLAAGLVAALAAAAQVPSSPPLAGVALGDALRRGGHVIFFRHAATDFSQSDGSMTSFDDCAKQRNLTDAGRNEARIIGEAIRRARIPVGEVLASPYCRTMETARLIFGRATATSAVVGGPPIDEENRYAALRAILAKGAPRGTNVAISSHANPFQAVAGPPQLAEGEAAIVAPGGPQGFRVIGRVRKDGWDELKPR